MKGSTPYSYVAMVVVHLAYGGSNILMKVALEKGLNQLVFVVYRHVIAMLLLSPFAYALERRQRPPLSFSVLLKICILSSLGTTAHLNLYYAGLKYTSPTVAVALSNVIPVLTFLIAFLLRMEKVNLGSASGRAKLFGTVICIGGSLIFTFWRGGYLLKGFVHTPLIEIKGSNNRHTEWIKGSVLILTSNVAWSAWLILNAVVCEIYPARLSLNVFICFFASLQSSILALFFARNPTLWRLEWNVQLFSIIYCGVVLSGLVYYLQIWCISNEGPVFVAMFNPLLLVVVGLFSAIAFAERLHLGRATQDGIGVLSPDDTVSLRKSVTEEEEVVDGAVNEVEIADVEEKVPSSLERTEKKKEDERYRDDSRYKLRNGREVFEEKAFLVGVARKGDKEDSFGIEESLKELAQLADTAGLMVVDSTYQKLATPNPKTYIGSGKVAEIKTAVDAFDVETVIFDDELSPGQLRNLEKVFGGKVRVCDRTALILDIFNQRAATREAALQVALAQMEYQLPRLTKMWTHLERQAGGQVKGMGEKQIEVDKRILRTQIGVLKKELESVRKHRKQYRNRRVAVPVPVVSLVGYTNAGKSTLLNRLTGANVLAEDRLFATLDPTTRRVQPFPPQMKNGKEFLLTDTVGFIQKLPTTLVAAFRATLEEISESSLLVHVVDISHPLAEQQIDAVNKILSELDASSIPNLMVWNKVDRTSNPHKIMLEAEKRGDTICISALNGDGLDDFCKAVQDKLKDSMVWVEALIPFDKGEILSAIHHVGMLEKTEYKENGTLIRAYVPLRYARLLTPMRQMCVS